MAGEDQTWLGVNAGDRIKSQIKPQNWRLENSRSNQTPIGERRKEVNSTPWLLGLAVFLLIIEAIFAWR